MRDSAVPAPGLVLHHTPQVSKIEFFDLNVSEDIAIIAMLRIDSFGSSFASWTIGSLHSGLGASTPDPAYRGPALQRSARNSQVHA